MGEALLVDLVGQKSIVLAPPVQGAHPVDHGRRRVGPGVTVQRALEEQLVPPVGAACLMCRDAKGQIVTPLERATPPPWTGRLCRDHTGLVVSDRVVSVLIFVFLFGVPRVSRLSGLVILQIPR